MTHPIAVLPWIVPSGVLVKLPEINASAYGYFPSVPLTEASAETLAWLCDEFRKDVFAAAGKKDPRQKKP